MQATNASLFYHRYLKSRWRNHLNVHSATCTSRCSRLFEGVDELRTMVATRNHQQIKQVVDSKYASTDQATVGAIKQLLGDFCRH